jgi:hypothetical protein
MYHIFAKAGGYDKLVLKYGNATRPDGTSLSRQTIKVGAVRWRWSGNIVLGSQGLFIALGGAASAIPLFGKLTPVLIPWSDFRSPRQGRLYLDWQAVELSVGNPEIAVITFPLDLYKKIAVYLDPSVSAGYHRS